MQPFLFIQACGLVCAYQWLRWHSTDQWRCQVLNWGVQTLLTGDFVIGYSIPLRSLVLNAHVENILESTHRIVYISRFSDIFLVPPVELIVDSKIPKF